MDTRGIDIPTLKPSPPKKLSNQLPEATENPIFGRGSEERIVLSFRDGNRFYYPYSHIALIECYEDNLIILNCTCGKVEKITIRGRNLEEIANYLCEQSLKEIREDDHPDFTDRNDPIVESIELRRVEPG